MSDDLPTPPLPDAIAITRQSRGRRMTLSRSVAPPRSFVVSACRSSGVMTPKLSDEAADAGNVGERRVDLLLEGVAERAAGDRQDDGERDDSVLDLDVPDHVELGDGRWSSGSMTFSRAARIASRLGLSSPGTFRSVPASHPNAAQPPGTAILLHDWIL